MATTKVAPVTSVMNHQKILMGVSTESKRRQKKYSKLNLTSQSAVHIVKSTAN